jgi:hypothetical protein
MAPQDLETSVKGKVLGFDLLHSSGNALVMRSVEDNIEKSLLQSFDAESDEETEDVNDNLVVALVDQLDFPCHPWLGRIRRNGAMSKLQE